MRGFGLDLVNIGMAALNLGIYKYLGGRFKKANLAAAWFCGLFGIGGLVINLFKLALSLNETM